MNDDVRWDEHCDVYPLLCSCVRLRSIFLPLLDCRTTYGTLYVCICEVVAKSNKRNVDDVIWSKKFVILDFVDHIL